MNKWKTIKQALRSCQPCNQPKQENTLARLIEE